MAHQHSRCLHHSFEKGLSPGAPRGDCRGRRAGWAESAEADQVEAIDATSPPPASGPPLRRQCRCPQPKPLNQQQRGGMAWIPKLPASGQASLPPPKKRMFAQFDAARCEQAGRRCCHNRTDPTRKDSHYCRSSPECVCSGFFSQLTAVAGILGAPGAPAWRGCGPLAGARPEWPARISAPCATARKAGRSVVGHDADADRFGLASGNLAPLRLAAAHSVAVSTLGPETAGPLLIRRTLRAGANLDAFGCPSALLPLPRCGPASAECLYVASSDGRSPPPRSARPRSGCWGCRRPSSQLGVGPAPAPGGDSPAHGRAMGRGLEPC